MGGEGDHASQLWLCEPGYLTRRPLAGSRISNINNFGHVALHISQLRSEDSGVYTVRATNKASVRTAIHVTDI